MQSFINDPNKPQNSSPERLSGHNYLYLLFVLVAYLSLSGFLIYRLHTGIALLVIIPISVILLLTIQYPLNRNQYFTFLGCSVFIFFTFSSISYTQSMQMGYSSYLEIILIGLIPALYVFALELSVSLAYKGKLTGILCLILLAFILFWAMGSVGSSKSRLFP